MMPSQEAVVRVLVLLIYIVAAAWMTWTHQDTPAAVIHITGAIAGLCAVSLAVTYAGLIGEATPDTAEDQGVAYMERMEQLDREEWDD